MNDGEGPKSRRKTSKKLVRLERIKNPPISLNSEITLAEGFGKRFRKRYPILKYACTRSLVYNLVYPSVNLVINPPMKTCYTKLLAT